MTEEEWFACTDPIDLHTYCYFRAIASAIDWRRYRLSMLAFVYSSSLPLDDEMFRGLGLAEKMVDGRLSFTKFSNRVRYSSPLSVAQQTVEQCWYSDGFHQFVPLSELLHSNRWLTNDEQRRLIRDQEGNPFSLPRLEDCFLFDWINEIARGCYHYRPRNRQLCPHRLHVLADALEEAGCQQEHLLRSLHGETQTGLTTWEPTGPRYRGYWALDHVLGKLHRE